MPKKVLSYNCDFCGTPFPEESAANVCERMHVELFQLKIVGCSYFQPTQTQFWVGSDRPQPPSVISVKWGDQSYEFATYRLQQVGPTPV